MHRSLLVVLVTFAAMGCGPSAPTSNEELAWTSAAIQNGTIISDAEYPSVVRVYMHGPESCGFTPNRSGVCTGTLIGQRTVVTAAHCLLGATADNVWVMTGSTTNLAADRMTPSTQSGRYYASSIELHPHWAEKLTTGDMDCNGHTTGPLDVGVIHLATDVPLSPTSTGLAKEDLLLSLPWYGFEMIGRSLTHVGIGFLTSWQGATDELGVRRKGPGTVSPAFWSQEESAKVCTSNGGSFDFMTSPSIVRPGDSGGPVFINIAGHQKLVAVHSWGLGANNPDHAAPSYSMANAAFLRDALGIAATSDVDSDCDGIGDFYDNCVDDWNFYQEDDNDDGAGNECTTCPYIQTPFDPENSNRLAEDVANADKLSDSCDPVPMERPDRIVPQSTLFKEAFVQGDGVGEDDVLDFSSSTFLGKETESDGVGAVKLSAMATYRWCNCVDVMSQTPLALQNCVNRDPQALCSVLAPTENPAWKGMSLTDIATNAPLVPLGAAQRDFSTDEVLGARTWRWNWYQDLKNDILLTDASSPQGLKFAWGALLAHVEKDSAVASARDQQFDLRDVYRLASTGPVLQQDLPIVPPARACAFPSCFSWWFGAECWMCNGLTSPLDRIVNPAILTTIGQRVVVNRLDDVAFDITSHVSDGVRDALGSDTQRWMLPVERRTRIVAAGKSAVGSIVSRSSPTAFEPQLVVTSPLGLALANEQRQLASVHNPDTSVPNVPPDNLMGATPVFSALHNAVYWIGGSTGNRPAGTIWRFDFTQSSWVSVGITPARLAPTAQVTSVAYDPFRSRLYVLDRERTFGMKFYRLVVVDVSTGEASRLATWLDLGLSKQVMIVVDDMGALLLVASHSHHYSAWRFDLNDSKLRLLGVRGGNGLVLDLPFMGLRSPELPVARSQRVVLDELAPNTFHPGPPCTGL